MLVTCTILAALVMSNVSGTIVCGSTICIRPLLNTISFKKAPCKKNLKVHRFVHEGEQEC